MVWSTPRTWVAGEVVTASIMNTHLRDQLDAGFPHGVTWQSYTPTLTATSTDPTLGTGSVQSGSFYRIGRLVVAHVQISFGSSGTAAGSGNYKVSLPTSVASIGSRAVGSGMVRDANVSQHYAVQPYRNSSTDVLMRFHGGFVVSASAPFTWAADDAIHLHFVYRAA